FLAQAAFDHDAVARRRKGVRLTWLDHQARCSQDDHAPLGTGANQLNEERLARLVNDQDLDLIARFDDSRAFVGLELHLKGGPARGKVTAIEAIQWRYRRPQP